MTFTTTHSDTFTLANARYVASKVAADLRRMQQHYGSPSDSDIDAYGEETAILLHGGYLDRVLFGFRRDGSWVVALEYHARHGMLTTDDRAGGIPLGIDTTGAHFHSYLTYSSAWNVLSSADKAEVKARLPVTRTSGTEPGRPGIAVSTRSYSVNNTGLSRSVLR